LPVIGDEDALESYVRHRSGGSPAGAVRSFLETLRERGVRPGHILDVGANVGLWSRAAADVFPRARISMIEPQQAVQAELRQTASELPDARVFPVAAGAAAERRRMALREDHPSSTFCDVGSYGEPAGYQDTEIIALDSLLGTPDFPRPDLVKIDVEGFELEVFKGAPAVLAGAEILIIECSFFQWYPMTPRFADIVSGLDQLGFEVYDFCWFLRRPLDDALGIADVCFARRDSPLRSNHRWSAPAAD
jgi:FkbM family methyltransferase